MPDPKTTKPTSNPAATEAAQASTRKPAIDEATVEDAARRTQSTGVSGEDDLSRDDEMGSGKVQGEKGLDAQRDKVRGEIAGE